MDVRMALLYLMMKVTTTTTGDFSVRMTILIVILSMMMRIVWVSFCMVVVVDDLKAQSYVSVNDI